MSLSLAGSNPNWKSLKFSVLMRKPQISENCASQVIGQKSRPILLQHSLEGMYQYLWLFNGNIHWEG